MKRDTLEFLRDDLIKLKGTVEMNLDNRYYDLESLKHKADEMSVAYFNKLEAKNSDL